jgi:hypothetical protein
MPINTYVSATVDTKYGSRFLQSLYENNFLYPNATFTNMADEGGIVGGAGVFKFYKTTRSTSNAPEKVGADYTRRDFANSEVTITLNNQLSESVKVPRATVAATSAPVLDKQLDDNARQMQVRQGRAAIACLYTEGTKKTLSAALTKDNIKDELLAGQADIMASLGAAPDVCLVSPEKYATILGSFSKEMSPTFIDQVNQYGRVNNWLGMNILPCAALSPKINLPYSYFDHNSSDTAKQVTAANLSKVEYIMYNHNTFALMELLSGIDTMKDPDSPSYLLNCDMVIGLSVLYPELVRVAVSSAT